MSNPSDSRHEPTMEEILASIRKIISEDSPETHAAESASSSHELEVLELTQEARDEQPPLVDSVPGAASAEEAHDLGRPRPSSDEEPARGDEPVSLHAEGIFSERSREALNAALGNLPAQGANDSVVGAPAPVSGLSLEAVFERAVGDAFRPVLEQWLGAHTQTIVERMKPTIREWMDEHFPAMLEDAVRAELARAVRTRGRR